MIDRYKLKKMLFYVITAFFGVLISISIYGLSTSFKDTELSTYNNGSKGLKALYLLTQKMGFKVTRSRLSARFWQDGAAMVIYKPDLEWFNDEVEEESVKKWIESGNTVIFIPEEEELNEYWILKYIKSNKSNSNQVHRNQVVINDYSVNSGRIIVIDSFFDLNNEELINMDAGIAFINVLSDIQNQIVVFNEYYHGIQSSGPSIWMLIGIRGQLIVIQLFLFILFYFLYKSKSFGTPITVFETIKRRENENLYALSNIYLKSNANDLVLENYFIKFKKDIAKYLGISLNSTDKELIIAASTNVILNKLNFEKLSLDCNNFISSSNKNKKQLYKLVGKIERIRKEIK